MIKIVPPSVLRHLRGATIRRSNFTAKLQNLWWHRLSLNCSVLSRVVWWTSAWADKTQGENSQNRLNDLAYSFSEAAAFPSGQQGPLWWISSSSSGSVLWAGWSTKEAERPIQRLLGKKEKGLESGLDPEIFPSGLIILFLAETTCRARILVGVVFMEDTRAYEGASGKSKKE